MGRGWLRGQGHNFGFLSCASVSQCDEEMTLPCLAVRTAWGPSTVLGKKEKSHVLVKLAELRYL